MKQLKMKTKIILDLKKEVLVIELPKGAHQEITPRLLAINKSDGSIQIFKGNYTLLGTPDEIKEQDVKDLVGKISFGFKNYKSKEIEFYIYALQSFFSAIEKEIYWNNPFQNVSGSVLDMTVGQWQNKSKFLEAEEKTFDKNRTLIFVKN